MVHFAPARVDKGGGLARRSLLSVAVALPRSPPSATAAATGEAVLGPLPPQVSWLSLLRPRPPVVIYSHSSRIDQSLVAMAASSSRGVSMASSSRHDSLPLINCPKCDIEVIRLTSKAGVVFYKCPNNIPDDKTCTWYWWGEDAYEKYLRKNHPQFFLDAQPVSSGSLQVEQPGELKMQMYEMKLQMCEVKMQISEMKMQLRDLKQEMDNRKNGSVSSNSVSVALLCACVALLVALFWK